VRLKWSRQCIGVQVLGSPVLFQEGCCNLFLQFKSLLNAMCLNKSLDCGRRFCVFQASASGFKVSKYRPSSSEFCVSSFGFWVSGFGSNQPLPAALCHNALWPPPKTSQLVTAPVYRVYGQGIRNQDSGFLLKTPRLVTSQVTALCAIATLPNPQPSILNPKSTSAIWGVRFRVQDFSFNRTSAKASSEALWSFFNLATWLKFEIGVGVSGFRIAVVSQIGNRVEIRGLGL
jgi:hypothetical protein